MNVKIIVAVIFVMTTTGCANNGGGTVSTLATRVPDTAEPTTVMTATIEPKIEYFPFGDEQLPLDTSDERLDGVLFAQTKSANADVIINLELVGFGVYTTAERAEYAYVGKLLLESSFGEARDSVQLDFDEDIIVASDMSNLKYDVAADQNTDEPVVTVQYRSPFDDDAEYKMRVYALSDGKFTERD